MNTGQRIEFPVYTGARCLMMPYIQGDPDSVPDEYAAYRDILVDTYLEAGARGYLTIDESVAAAGSPHRGARARFSRALHTEAGRAPGQVYRWGGGGWGRAPHRVTLDRYVGVLLANNTDDTCAVWPGEHPDTSSDGDIGHLADAYPYEEAVLIKAGEVHRIGILTPHESLPVPRSTRRQFLRIVGDGVHGREPYFTPNPRVV